MNTQPAITSSLPSGHPRHLLRVLVTWTVLSAIGTPLVYYVLAPHLAPGTMTTSAASQQWDMTVLLSAAVPVMLAVYIWFGYSLIFFRQKKDTPLEDGVWVPRDSLTVQIGWLVGTTLLVLSLFVFGTYELIVPAGAGGGEGPSAIWHPSGVVTAAKWTPAAKSNSTIQVQVIAQQWKFTYRWPQFGGMETTGINLPVNTPIQFNVTSLDVIHDFWAYRLGVKADANPGVNDIAFTTATQTGPFTVRCDELCGLWHGAMVNPGAVVSRSAFYSWATGQEKIMAPVTAKLPTYAAFYTPSLNGAGGGFYDGNDTPLPKSEQQ